VSDDDASDGELRRRAAWLLGMLVLVAVLVVVIMTTVLKSGKNHDGDGAVGPDAIRSTGPATSTPAAARTSHSRTSSTAGSTTGSTSSGTGSATCPTSAPCALDGDVGNAIPAINAYRTAHGKSAVPASVSEAAKQCALHRGNGCSGGWAETELSAPANGAQAVAKISQFARFLEPMKSIEVGWAYDPSTKTYYFSTIRRT